MRLAGYVARRGRREMQSFLWGRFERGSLEDVCVGEGSVLNRGRKEIRGEGVGWIQMA